MSVFAVFRRKIKTAADGPIAEGTTPEAAASDATAQEDAAQETAAGEGAAAEQAAGPSAEGGTPAAEASEPDEDAAIRVPEEVEIPRQQSVAAAADNETGEGALK
jgi:hypothetical protein